SGSDAAGTDEEQPDELCVCLRYDDCHVAIAFPPASESSDSVSRRPPPPRPSPRPLGPHARFVRVPPYGVKLRFRVAPFGCAIANAQTSKFCLTVGGGREPEHATVYGPTRLAAHRRRLTLSLRARQQTSLPNRGRVR